MTSGNRRCVEETSFKQLRYVTSAACINKVHVRN